ncbi:MAG: hypothetical protein ABI597_00900 [Gammaproteobacteria bacterium]
MDTKIQDSQAIVDYYKDNAVSVTFPRMVFRIRYFFNDNKTLMRTVSEEKVTREQFVKKLAAVEATYLQVQKEIDKSFIQAFKQRQIAHFQNKENSEIKEEVDSTSHLSTEMQAALKKDFKLLDNLLTLEVKKAVAIVASKCRSGVALTKELAEELSLALFVGRDISYYDSHLKKMQLDRAIVNFIVNLVTNITEINNQVQQKHEIIIAPSKKSSMIRTFLNRKYPPLLPSSQTVATNEMDKSDTFKCTL